jgi:transposase
MDMAKAVTIGLDLAKDVFQLHGVDKKCAVVLRCKLKRAEVLPFFRKLKPTIIGIEACSGSHYWARSLTDLGHEVKIMPAKYVKAYVKTQKNDRIDAEAICEAVRRPTMRFVPRKNEGQQGVLMLHRTRSTFTNLRTKLINTFRAHLAEFGAVDGRGRAGFSSLSKTFHQTMRTKLPAQAIAAIEPLIEEIQRTEARIDELDAELLAWHRTNAQSQRLVTIPGVGVQAATFIAASVPDPSVFRNGRCMAAWLGLVPKQYSTGGKSVLGPITKTGNKHLRRLLFLGARALILGSRRKSKKTVLPATLESLIRGKKLKLACIAFANKIARMAWAMMSSGETYNPRRAVTCAG